MTQKKKIRFIFLFIGLFIILFTSLNNIASVSAVNYAPTVGAVIPNSGQSVVNQEQIFTTNFSDANGWSDINYGMFLIDDNTDGINAVYLRYLRASNLIYLANGAGVWDSTRTCTPGQNKIIENSFGKLNCSKTSISGNGNTLTIKWSVSFKNASVGRNFNLYLYAKDNLGLRVGFIDKGDWKVVTSPNLPPSVDSVTPNSGQSLVNQEQIFTTNFSDANGWSDINYGMFLIDDNTDGINAVYLRYLTATNLVYISDDSGNWISTRTCTPGQNKIIENSFGKLNCSKTSVLKSGNTMTVSWPVSFKNASVGRNFNLYLYAKDNLGLRVGFIDKGDWKVVEQGVVGWLKKQQDLYTGGLVDSYENDGVDYAYTYDQALSIISFTEAGEIARAKKVLDRMKALQSVSGGWLDCYKSSNYAVCNSGQDRYSTGPIAWMVIAINYYEMKTLDSSYSSVAVKAITWMDSMRNINPADEKYGSIRFCSGNSCTIPDAISTEHNHDAYSAYFWRGIITNNNDYKNKADLIKNYLINEMWAPSPNSNGPYHNVNVFWRGYNDFAWCTDTQTWGVLSLGKTGTNGEEFYKSLDWLYDNPYGSTRNKQNYDSTITAVDGFKSCTEELTNYIWIEGTEGASSAYYSINDNRGDYFHNEMKKIPLDNGGVQYSFSDTNPGILIYPNNWRHGSIASSAWFYFNEKKINPFVPGIAPVENYYSVTKVNVGNNIEYRSYYKQHHFMTIIIDANGAFAIRPHPGVDINGWGSTLYLHPFLPGATLKGSVIKNISVDSNGIRVVANGLVSQGGAGSYGNWNINISFNYNPALKEINGNGKYNINLNSALSSSTGDLNIYKLASNYLDDVPLLNGSNGDTGDMKYAEIKGNPFDFIWYPPMQTSHFPGEIRNPISIEAVGDYNQVDTAKQGYQPIAAAYKPSIKVVLTCQQAAPIIFGGIYNTAESKQFWSDNVGITPLVLKTSTYTTYNFDIQFNSKAIAGDK